METKRAQSAQIYRETVRYLVEGGRIGLLPFHVPSSEREPEHMWFESRRTDGKPKTRTDGNVIPRYDGRAIHARVMRKVGLDSQLYNRNRER